MAIAGRHGELEGHMHGYDPAVVARGLAQTAADSRITYAAVPDEVAALVHVRAALVAAAGGPRCLVPWRDEARQFTYYCLLEAGHDDEARYDAAGVRYDAGAVDLGAASPSAVELTIKRFVSPGQFEPEHGWYRLLDAYARGDQAMTEAADRIAERAAAARTRSPR